MRKEDVRVAAQRVDDLFPPFERLFGKAAARTHARTYVKGLMSNLARKSIDPIAQALGGSRRSALQKFLNIAPWHASDLHKELQRSFGARQQAEPLGPVTLIVVEHGFIKKGRESVGVARQWNPRTRRIENCQVGLFLIAVAGEISCMLDARLYLPVSWCDGSEETRKRRLRAHVPVGTHHRTKSQIALDLLRRCVALGFVTTNLLAMEESIANDGDIREQLSSQDRPFLVGVPQSQVIFVSTLLCPGVSQGHQAATPNDEVAITATSLCEALASDHWNEAAIQTGDAIDHVEYAMVRVRLSSPAVIDRPFWLLIRGKSDLDRSAPEFYLTNTGPSAVLLLLEALQRIDEGPAFFPAAEEFLGLGHYETRSWGGWHHHMSLASLAHWLVISATSASQVD